MMKQQDKPSRPESKPAKTGGNKKAGEKLECAQQEAADERKKVGHV
jgi:hypothetical protein